ncbi:MAG: hypothetical protein ACTSSQ_05505 [Alphaproteobacteria bacterium]
MMLDTHPPDTHTTPTSACAGLALAAAAAVFCCFGGVSIARAQDVPDIAPETTPDTTPGLETVLEDANARFQPERAGPVALADQS